MKILDLQTFGILGVPDGFYDFSVPADGGRGQAQDLVIVTGPSGSGKTRFLELIAAVLEILVPNEDDLPVEHWIRPDHRAAKVKISWLLSEEEQRLVGAPNPVHRTETIFGRENPVSSTDELLIHLFARYDHSDSTSKVEYFAENRRLDESGADMKTDPRTQVQFRSNKSLRKYAFVPAFLRELKNQRPKAERFAESLGQLSKTCSYDLENGHLVSRGRPIHKLLELSGSERDALLFAATAANVGLSRSIVLVDRPEMMGALLRDTLPGLLGLGSHNQLFVATARPEQASGARHTLINLSAVGGAS